MATSNRWLAVPQLLFVVSLAAATSCSGSAEQSDEPLAATPELCAVASDYAMSSESRREGFPVDPPDPGVYLQELARTSSGSLHQDIQDLIKLYEKSHDSEQDYVAYDTAAVATFRELEKLCDINIAGV